MCFTCILHTCQDSINVTELVWILPQLLDNWVHSQVLVIVNILNSPAINIFMQVLPPPFPLWIISLEMYFLKWVYWVKRVQWTVL